MSNQNPANDQQTSQAPTLRRYFIATIGNPYLRRKTSLVSPEIANKYILYSKALCDLKDVAKILSAAGMAANQLLYDMRICVVRMNNGEYETMVNPKLTPTENPVFVVDQEACYSIPGFTARVTRCKEITVEYISEFGEYKKGLLTGPEAQYTQHEVDHLDGVLISDKNPMFGQSKLTKLQRRFKKYNFIYSVDELGHFDFEPEHGAIQNTVNPFAS